MDITKVEYITIDLIPLLSFSWEWSHLYFLADLNDVILSTTKRERCWMILKLKQCEMLQPRK